MNSINFPDQREVEEKAATWVAIIDRGISDAEQLELEQWLELSPTNGEALVKCASMWDLLDVLQPIAKLLPIDTNALEIEPKKAANDRSWFSSIAVAASVLLLLGAAIIMQPINDSSSESSPVAQQTKLSTSQAKASDLSKVSLRYKTAIGEFSSFSLADGSVVDLNTDTELEVSFSDTARNIRLVRGEAYFEVAKDPSKPFVVNVGSDKVTAVGTAFSVNAEGSFSAEMSVKEVIVTEGKVRLNSAREKQAVYLSLGQKAVANDNVLEVSNGSDSDSLLAWREGFVVFQGESLTEVVREIDRYTPLRFRLMDAELASVSVGGYFKTGDLEQLLMVLENNFGVSNKRVGDEILLSKRASTL